MSIYRPSGGMRGVVQVHALLIIAQEIQAETYPSCRTIGEACDWPQIYSASGQPQTYINVINFFLPCRLFSGSNCCEAEAGIPIMWPLWRTVTAVTNKSPQSQVCIRSIPWQFSYHVRSALRTVNCCVKAHPLRGHKYACSWQEEVKNRFQRK